MKLRIILFSWAGTLLVICNAFAADGHGQQVDKIKLEISALVGVGLWALIEKIVKPILKKFNINLTSNFAVFQPLLLAAATGITAFVCKTGLCEYVVSDGATHSTGQIVASGVFSWIVAQFVHDIQPSTNSNVSSSGGDPKTGG